METDISRRSDNIMIYGCWVNKEMKQVILEFSDYTYALYKIRTNKKFRFRSHITGRIKLQTKLNGFPYLDPDSWKYVRKGRQIPWKNIGNVEREIC